MRPRTVAFLLPLLVVVAYLTYRCRTLISLLFEDKSVDMLHGWEILPPDSPLIVKQEHRIPKIIHQTYKNETIPERWLAGQQACIDLHPDYEYKLWTDATAREFIAREYSWFLEDFDSYPYGIQRADAIRYFILDYYGGIYLDLDDGCQRRLDPLLAYPAWLRSTKPTGISNDAMGAIPHHPFFQRVTKELSFYNRNWLAPYITIMYSTGPLFLSAMWMEYTPTAQTPDDRIRVLMPDEYSDAPWAFFNISKGNSWHQGDADTIFWMGQHWIFLTLLGFALAAAVGYAVWLLWVPTLSLDRGSPKFSKESSERRAWWSVFTFWTRRGNSEYELIARIA